MHRVPGPNRLSGPAQGDHGFPGVGVYCMSGFGDQRSGQASCMSSCVCVLALCRAKRGALQNSGADQVGSVGFGRRRGDGLQQHLRKLLVVPVVLLQGWVSEPVFYSLHADVCAKWRSWFAVSVEYWNLVAESENHRSVGYWVLVNLIQCMLDSDGFPSWRKTVFASCQTNCSFNVLSFLCSCCLCFNSGRGCIERWTLNRVMKLMFSGSESESFSEIQEKNNKTELK